MVGTRMGYLAAVVKLLTRSPSVPVEASQETETVSVYGWIVVTASFFILILAYGGIYSFGVFFGSLQEDLGWSAAATSGVFSLYLLSYCLFSSFSGWAVDTLGPKIVISLGGLFIGLGFLFASNTHRLWHIYLCYGLLIGIGMGAVYAPLLVTTSRWVNKRRGLALGIVSSGIGTGTLLIPLLASYLNLKYGWRMSYIIMGSLAGGGIIILAALSLKKDPSFRGLLKRKVEPNEKIGAYILESYSIRKIVFSELFWLLALVYLMVGFGLQMITVHLVPYIVKIFRTTQICAAGVFTTMGASSIVGRLLMGALSDTIGGRKALIICVLLEGAAILVFINISGTYVPYFFAILFGFGLGGHNPQFPALTGELFGLRKMGSIIGLHLIFYGIGGAFGSFLAGSVLDKTGSYHDAFGLGGVAMLLAAAFSLRLRRPTSC